jgi:hypothetical protein
MHAGAGIATGRLLLQEDRLVAIAFKTRKKGTKGTSFVPQEIDLVGLGVSF